MSPGPNSTIFLLVLGSIPRQDCLFQASVISECHSPPQMVNWCDVKKTSWEEKTIGVDEVTVSVRGGEGDRVYVGFSLIFKIRCYSPNV